MSTPDYPLVSIAVAMYNGEKYLAEQLDSLVQQTWPNLEIVVVDDQSTDRSVALVESYQTRYPNIKLYRNPTNSGVTRTFEAAVRQCSGEFIALSDQDDIWDLHKIEWMMGEFGQEDVVYCNSILIDGKGELLNRHFGQVMKLRSYYSGAPFLLANCVPGHTILMRADFAKLVLPYPPHIYFDRWISFCAASRNGIKYYDKGLVYYRQHETNTVGVGKTRNKKNKPTARQLYEAKRVELETFARAPIEREETKLLLAEMIRHYHRGWSLARSLFFFRNIDTILVIKSKPYYRKVLYCIKMFFKPNY